MKRFRFLALLVSATVGVASLAACADAQGRAAGADWYASYARQFPCRPFDFAVVPDVNFAKDRACVLTRAAMDQIVKGKAPETAASDVSRIDSVYVVHVVIRALEGIEGARAVIYDAVTFRFRTGQPKPIMAKFDFQTGRIEFQLMGREKLYP